MYQVEVVKFYVERDVGLGEISLLIEVDDKIVKKQMILNKITDFQFVIQKLLSSTIPTGRRPSGRPPTWDANTMEETSLPEVYAAHPRTKKRKKDDEQKKLSHTNVSAYPGIETLCFSMFSIF